ncbi:MAG: hypothetical protein M0R39_16540 [Prolixibacteraceae bacterium]|nr:hypothetical protein [Prolixibacteraceae bacterium]
MKFPTKLLIITLLLISIISTCKTSGNSGSDPIIPDTPKPPIKTTFSTYYVAPNGSNSNNGTSPGNPFLTIQKSLDIAIAGDTVNIMAGTYPEALVLKTTGTSSRRITLRQYNTDIVTINSENSRAVRLNAVIGYYTLDGLKFISNYVGAYVGTADYSIDLGIGGPGWWGQGFPKDNAAAVDDDSNGHNGFIVQNCDITGNIGFLGHNNVVSNCNLNGNNAFTNGIHDGTVVSHNNIFTHNTISHYTVRGLWIWSNVYNDTASYNNISHYGICAIDFDGASLPVYNSVMANNVIHDEDRAKSMGMQFENGMNCVCENNLIYNVVEGMTCINYYQGSGGNTGVYGYAYYNFQVQDPNNLVMGKVPYVTNNIFRNNLVYNTSSSGAHFMLTWGNYLYNNTFDNCKGSYGAIALTNGATSVGCLNTTITNNILSNCSSGVILQSGGSITSESNNLFYNNTSNGSTGTNVVLGNPLYVNANTGQYKLQSSSPAKDAGAAISAVTTDMAGTKRPQGTAYDIGAYEY